MLWIMSLSLNNISFSKSNKLHRRRKGVPGMQYLFSQTESKASETCFNYKHHAFGLLLSLRLWERLSRRRGGDACSHFFPRFVGFGPTDSLANVAFVIQPSTLSQVQLIPCIHHSVPSRLPTFSETRQLEPIPCNWLENHESACTGGHPP